MKCIYRNNDCIILVVCLKYVSNEIWEIQQIFLVNRLQSGDTVGVRPGCAVEPVTLATFPPASPGYAQLMHMDLNGRIEISFMFRTLQVLETIVRIV